MITPGALEGWALGRRVSDMGGVFFSFLGPYSQPTEVPRSGVESELQLRAVPQPWQPWTRAVSATYATACGDAESLTL